MTNVLKALSTMVCACIFTSCIQHSTVVRVRKNGSGEIFVRNYFSPVIAAMAGSEGNISLTQNGEDPWSPSANQLKQDEDNYGKSVRFVRFEENLNKENWRGYLVVYEFDDIADVKLDAKLAIPPGLKTAIEGDSPNESETGGQVVFEREGDILKMRSDIGNYAVREFLEKGIKNNAGPVKLAGAKPTEKLAMIADLFSGMRYGYYINIDGGIAESNATHIQDNYISVVDIDVVRFLKDPEFLAFADEGAEKPTTITKEKINTLIPQIEALKAEMQPLVTVKFN